MASSPYRSRLGPGFSEGSRQLWLVVQRLGGQTLLEIDFNAAFPESTIDVGTLSRYLYGDRRPELVRAVQLRDRYGIDPAAWCRDPDEPFTLPGARASTDESGEHVIPADDDTAEKAS